MICGKVCETLNGNGLMPYKILTTPTNTDFLRIFYICEFNVVNLFHFRHRKAQTGMRNATLTVIDEQARRATTGHYSKHQMFSKSIFLSFPS
ncbi:hypothetical protein HanIR_Chr07g0324551 [Helianthus annuus]|nr:hypothetical protein HanIR_Chr07g0324551 [Helianthus annuus]